MTNRRWASAAVAALAVGGCVFDPSFTGTSYRCDESGRCPSGMVCAPDTMTCVLPGDGGSTDGTSCSPPSIATLETARSSTGSPAPPVSSLDLEVDVGQPGLVLVAIVAHRAHLGQRVTEVVYGGRALTSLCRASGVIGDEYVTHAFYLSDPAEGSALLAASFDQEADSVVVTAVQVAGADASAPIADFHCEGAASASGDPTPIVVEIALPASPCELVLGAVTTYIDGNELTPRAGVNQRWKEGGPVGWNTLTAGGTRPGAGDEVTIGWTAAVDWPWSIVALSLAGAR